MAGSDTTVTISTPNIEILKAELPPTGHSSPRHSALHNHQSPHLHQAPTRARHRNSNLAPNLPCNSRLHSKIPPLPPRLHPRIPASMAPFLWPHAKGRAP